MVLGAETESLRGPSLCEPGVCSLSCPVIGLTAPRALKLPDAMARGHQSWAVSQRTALQAKKTWTLIVSVMPAGQMAAGAQNQAQSGTRI